MIRRVAVVVTVGLAMASGMLVYVTAVFLRATPISIIPSHLRIACDAMMVSVKRPYSGLCLRVRPQIWSSSMLTMRASWRPLAIQR